MIEFAPALTEIKMDWYSAVVYCQFLEIDGKKDWRLPTMEELVGIDGVDNDNLYSSLSYKVYWSNDEVDTIPDVAWGLGFGPLGRNRQIVKKNNNHGCVRAVRDI